VENIDRQTPEQQVWTSFGAVIGDIAVFIETPSNFTPNEKGEVDVARATVSLVDTGDIVIKAPLQVGDISNALVTAFQHVVLGRSLPEGIDREAARTALLSAMVQVNISGGRSVSGNTRDQGQFEFDAATVVWDRLVSGQAVITNYHVSIPRATDSGIQQGTWLTLQTTVADVKPAEDQYLEFASAYMGEGK